MKALGTMLKKANPLNKIKLEMMVTWYIQMCGGDNTREARQQARSLIVEGPDNPFK